MTDLGVADLHQRKKRWFIATCLCGALLAISIIAGLGATVWRLQKTMELVDDTATSGIVYGQMVDRSILRGKLGLAIGCVAFAGYLYSFVNHHRAKERLVTARDEERHRVILDELLDEDPE